MSLLNTIWPRKKKARRRRVRAYLYFALGIIFLSLMVWVSSVLQEEQRHLDQVGIPATATVQDKVGPHYRGRKSYYLKVRFTDRTKMQQDASVEVSKDTFNEYQPGYEVAILYDPVNPSSAKTQYTEVNYWGWVIWAVGFGVIMGLLSLPQHIRKWKQQQQLKGNQPSERS